VNFKEVSSIKTEVVLIHLGWPYEKSWDPVYKYFEEAWDIVLGELYESCKKMYKFYIM